MVALQRQRLIPHLVVAEIARAVEFYKRAFGAEEDIRAGLENGSEPTCVALRIGPAVFHVCDALPEDGCGPEWEKHSRVSVTLHLEVEDCDHVLARAVAAGAEVIIPPRDMSWGDRYARIRDPFGHEWSFAHTGTQQQRFAA
jgi:PhnB protein